MPATLTWTIVTSMWFLAFLVWGLFVFYTQQSKMVITQKKRFAVISGAYLFGWLLLSLVLGSSGVFQANQTTLFPVIALGIAVPIIVGVFLLRHSSSLNSAIESVPLPWLAGVQLYRAFGFIFLALYALGKLPAEFAIPAGVGDVLVGLTAPVVGYLFFKGYRWSCLVVLGWSVVGIADLVIAVTFGFLSSPGPFQVHAIDAPNELITAFPLVLVPVFAVPLSILLHLATLKRLRGVVGVASNKGFKCDQPMAAVEEETADLDAARDLRAHEPASGARNVNSHRPLQP